TNTVVFAGTLFAGFSGSNAAARRQGFRKDLLRARESARKKALFSQAPVRKSSINAASFSSACTTKRFPSSRCASAIQIVRLLESIAETQPQTPSGFSEIVALRQRPCAL